MSFPKSEMEANLHKQKKKAGKTADLVIERPGEDN